MHRDCTLARSRYIFYIGIDLLQGCTFAFSVDRSAKEVSCSDSFINMASGDEMAVMQGGCASSARICATAKKSLKNKTSEGHVFLQRDLGPCMASSFWKSVRAFIRSIFVL